MQERFDEILRGLFPDKGTVLLAVSGGRDSVCMADLFLHSSCPVRFEVAHCNFSLRGADSDKDEALVRHWCSVNNIPFNTTRFDTKAYAVSRNISIEMAARELRYTWLGKLCNEKGISAVAVAHNANDNAETLMLNMLRGTGIKGIVGMKLVSGLPVKDYGDIRLIRPLLEFTRAEIDEYFSKSGPEYRDDKTNDETGFKRNKLRHLVFPVFEEINPSFLRTFSKEMRNFSQVDSIADEYYYSRRRNIVTAEAAGELRLNTASLLSYSHWKYLLFRILDEYAFGTDTADSLAAVICGEGTVSGKIFNNEKYRIVTSGDEIIIAEVRDARIASSGKPIILDKFRSIEEGDCCIAVEGSGLYDFNGKRFEVERLDWQNTLSAKTTPGTLIWDADKLPLPVLLSVWKDGDWIRPLGLGGRKKLSDLFVDLKFSLLDKEKAVVLIGGKVSTAPAAKIAPHSNEMPTNVGRHVQALLCLRIDEGVKVTENTKAVYRIRQL